MHLGETDYTNSVRPIWNKLTRGLVRQTRWDRFALLGETEMLRKGNSEFTLQSRWDRSALSVRPKSLGFVAVAMTSELSGAG